MVDSRHLKYKYLLQGNASSLVKFTTSCIELYACLQLHINFYYSTETPLSLKKCDELDDKNFFDPWTNPPTPSPPAPLLDAVNLVVYIKIVKKIY